MARRTNSVCLSMAASLPPGVFQLDYIHDATTTKPRAGVGFKAAQGCSATDRRRRIRVAFVILVLAVPLIVAGLHLIQRPFGRLAGRVRPQPVLRLTALVGFDRVMLQAPVPLAVRHRRPPCRSGPPTMIAPVTAIKPHPVSPLRPVPRQIARPHYVGRPAPDRYRGSDVQSAEVIEKMRVAGRIAAQAMHVAADAIAPGVTTDHLDAVAHEF